MSNHWYLKKITDLAEIISPEALVAWDRDVNFLIPENAVNPRLEIYYNSQHRIPRYLVYLSWMNFYQSYRYLEDKQKWERID